MYEVIVGNIGTVYSGKSEILARNRFKVYQQDSIAKIGRAAGEPVTLMRDGNIIAEHLGTVTIDDDDDDADVFGI